MDILDAGIILIHAISCAVGLLQKPLKSTPFFTGILAVGVSTVLLLIILEGAPGGPLGTHGGWYLIFSVLSVGLVPVFTLGSAFWSGRFFSALVRRRP